MADKQTVGNSLPATLPPLPEHCIEAWARLERDMSDCRTRLGLRYVLAGWSYREAAAEADLIDHGVLVKAVQRHGLVDLAHRTDRLASNHRQVAILATEELIERGAKDGFKEDASRDVAVVAGVSTDKVRDWEKRNERPQDALSLLQQIAGGLADAGMRLDLSLQPAGEVEDGATVVECAVPPTVPRIAR